MKKSIMAFLVAFCILFNNASIASATESTTVGDYTFIENGDTTTMINPEGDTFIIENVND